MAIYRTGQASMDANGYITGYGTKWKTALTLIRPGATIVFASNPVAYATISEIVSDTSLRAISSGGAVVPKGDYVILLHDSLTVDGLAQDVAETLRYYQGQETMYEHFVEFLKGFDWQRMEQLGEKAYADAKAAEASANAAKASETNANASKNAAAGSASAAKTSETNAKASETSATASKNAAKTSEDNAAASKNASASSASAAAGSATSASNSAATAKSEADRAADLAKQLDATNLMRKDANLSDVMNKAAARENLQVDRLFQGSTVTTVGKSGGNRLAVNDGGEWGALDSGNNWIALGVGKGGTGARDAAGARENLGLGTSNTVTFSQVRAPNGMICTTESNSANDNPSAPIVMQVRASDKSTILGQAEFRADRNGALSIINRTVHSSPKFFIIQSTGEVNPPGEIVSNSAATFSSMEVGKKNPNSASYIDFHYGAKYDYDARIICDGMNSDRNGGGNLRFIGGYMSHYADGGHYYNGGRFTISTTDVNIDTQTWFKFNGSAIMLQNKTANYASNILSKDVSGDNLWFVGRGSNNDDTVTLHNYRFNTNMHLRRNEVYVNTHFASQGNLTVNGNSLFVDGGSGASSTYLWLRNSSKKGRGVIYSNDSQQVLYFRADNVSTGALGRTMSWNGETGDLTVTSLSQTSDERAKFWIKPVTGALDKICDLKGVTFSMHTTIQNTVRNAGVIAQDVRKVLPEAVTEHKTNKNAPVIDKNCQPVESPLSVDYNALSALYVEAIKELRGIVDAQKYEIEKLKADIEIMKIK